MTLPPKHDAELASNGLYKDYVYDNMQRLRQLTHYRTDGSLADIADLSDDPRVVRFDYTVRADGRRTAADEFWYTAGSATQTSPLQASYQFTYDNLGRLTDEVFDHWDNSLDYRDRFAYDPAGNRIEKSRDAGRDGSVDARTAYRFDVNDRLIDALAYGRTSDPDSRTTYTYDHTQNTGYRSERFVSGSQTRTTLTHVYTYDLQGRLFTATVTNYNDTGTASSITRSTYDYGHSGIRVSALNEIDSTADGTFETRTKIEYLVDHSNHTGYQQVIRESHYDVATGKLIKTVDYTFGHDEISQTVVTYNAAGTEVSRDKQWFLHDGKANVRGLLDAAAAILTIAGIEQIYFYDAYGSLLNLQASQAATTLLYNGEMFDALTGNQYLRARYYNPLNAQFNRLDPFFGNHQDPQSFNKYAYVHGDPVTLSDPLGLNPDIIPFPGPGGIWNKMRLMWAPRLWSLVSKVGPYAAARILYGLIVDNALGYYYVQETRRGNFAGVDIDLQIARRSDPDIGPHNWDDEYKKRPDIVDHNVLNAYEIKPDLQYWLQNNKIDRYVELLSARYRATYTKGFWSPRPVAYVVRVPHWAFDFPIPTFWVRARRAEPGVIVYSEVYASGSAIASVVVARMSIHLVQQIALRGAAARATADSSRAQSHVAAAAMVAMVLRLPI